MVIKFQRGRVRASALCILVLALTGGCGQQTTEGQAATRPPDIYFEASQAVGNGTVKTFVKPDPSGQPAEVGLVMSASSMDGLAAEDTIPPTMVMLGFPPEAKATVLDHVMMNWNSHGHKPAELFGKPHFDFHFYLSDAASVMAIDPGGAWTSRPKRRAYPTPDTCHRTSRRIPGCRPRTRCRPWGCRPGVLDLPGRTDDASRLVTLGGPGLAGVRRWAATRRGRLGAT
jgi:hypothetical protein